jgi:spore germination cell wall hydrolase CwlJ-like protein
LAFDLEIMALTIAAEASSGSQAEREAVGWTITNRCRSGKYPANPAGVCLQRMQYSEWNGDTPDNRNLLRVAEMTEDSVTISNALAAAKVAQGLPGLDPTGGATHYHDRSIDPPSWARPPAEIALETPNFIFYRGVA